MTHLCARCHCDECRHSCDDPTPADLAEQAEAPGPTRPLDPEDPWDAALIAIAARIDAEHPHREPSPF